MRSGKVYGKFRTGDGREVILRSPRWEDLDGMLSFATELVKERDVEPDFGVTLDTVPTRTEEARWLADRLASMEKGDTVGVVAEVDGRLGGNSEVFRKPLRDLQRHGTLGISVLKGYRDSGIGGEMMKALMKQCSEQGFKTLELEAFATNERALHLYEKVGFRRAGVIPKKIWRDGRSIDMVVMAAEL